MVSPDEMRKCTKCDTVQPISSYPKYRTRYGEGYRGICSPCRYNQLRAAPAYKKNVTENRTALLKRNREFVAEALSSGCVDCGIKDIRVLDFDHTGDNKTKSVSYMLGRSYGTNALLKEIAKCVVRCKNCHAIKTYERLGNVWRVEYHNNNKEEVA